MRPVSLEKLLRVALEVSQRPLKPETKLVLLGTGQRVRFVLRCTT